MQVEYQLIRSNRKTMTLKIKDGQVVVLAPLFCAKATIDEFVLKHYDWIQKHLLNEGINVYINLQKDDSIYILGKKYLLFCTLNRPREVVLGENMVEIRGKNVKDLYRALSEYFYDIIQKRVGFEKARLGVSFAEAYRTYTSRWGCCNKKEKKITMNLLSACLPVENIDAIIDHEIAHLKYANHQKEFYDELLKYCPNYKKLNKELKKYHISVH